MPLINRGRLSVQTVSKVAFEAVVKLGETGIQKGEGSPTGSNNTRATSSKRKKKGENGTPVKVKKDEVDAVVSDIPSRENDEGLKIGEVASGELRRSKRRKI